MPSDYTSNLGIERIFTGEQSGTWGDTTNTNWDIVDQAINGIISITLPAVGTSGAPNDIPVTDGAVSNGQNKFIEFVDGGDLGGTAFVRITPNDAEKIVHIRNSLTASRSINIFQGTYNAANDFTLAAGQDVVLKFDGGGGAATVTQVFVNLTVDTITAATGIEGIVGGTTPADGSFTTLSATGTVTGPSGTWDAGGMDIATTDTYAIAGTDVLNATTLGTGVLASSLTSLGTIASLVATTADINGGTFDGIVGGTTPADGSFTTLSATSTVTGPSGSWTSIGMDLATTDSYFINGNNVLSQTTLGSTVLASSLTSVGTLASLGVTGTITGPSGTWDAGGMDIATTDTYAIASTDVLSATTLGSGVTASSLTSVGTIATGVWQGTAINQTYLVGQSGTNTGDELAASVTVSGVVELATVTETNTGTDATRAVTPDGLNDWTGGAGAITKLGTIATGVWQGTAINQTYLTGQSGTNTGDELAASLTVSGVVELATVAETNTGTDATRAVTPAGITGWTGGTALTTLGTIATGTWQGTAINQTYLVGQSGTNTGDEVASSATVSGVIELATQAEVDAGTDALRAVTPDTLTNFANFPTASAASTTVSGISEMATVAETNTGTDATRSVTPAGLEGWTGSAFVTTLGTIGSLVATTADINGGTFDGIVGGTTPADGSFTTLSATGTVTGPSGTWDAGGMDIATTDTYAIAGTNVLTATALGTGVLASSLTSLGTIASLVATTADINGGTFDGIVGGTTPAAGSFTTLISGSLFDNNAGTVELASGSRIRGTAGGDVQLESGNANSALLPTLTFRGDPNTGIFWPAADTIGFTTAGAEAMRIDSSGNVGIGDSTPVAKFEVKGSNGTDDIDGMNAPSVAFFGDGGASVGTFGINVDDTTDRVIFLRSATNGADMAFVVRSGSVNSEAMRIDSTGGVLVGLAVSRGADDGILEVYNSSTTNSYHVATFSTANTGTGASNKLVGFLSSSTTAQGAIAANGAGVAAFSTFSDERLKENITPLSGELAKIMALNPVEWDFKDGSGHQAGFIAQDMFNVYPENVDMPENPDEMMSIGGWSKEDARLVKAIQELTTRLEALEGA